MRRKNLAQILKKYPEQWVSLSKDYQRVLAAGTSLQSVIDTLAKRGNPQGVIVRSAKDYSRYAGSANVFSD